MASMRPSDITDGIWARFVAMRAKTGSFNEAVGYYRRNQDRGKGSIDLDVQLQ